MSETLDVYAEWLGLSPDQGKPDYYTLLGIETGESRAKVIKKAAQARTKLVRPMCLKYPQLGTDLLNEIAEAKLCLLDAGRRAAYDRELASAGVLHSVTTEPELVPPNPPAEPAPPLPSALDGLDEMEDDFSDDLLPADVAQYVDSDDSESRRRQHGLRLRFCPHCGLKLLVKETRCQSCAAWSRTAGKSRVVQCVKCEKTLIDGRVVCTRCHHDHAVSEPPKAPQRPQHGRTGWVTSSGPVAPPMPSMGSKDGLDHRNSVPPPVPSRRSSASSDTKDATAPVTFGERLQELPPVVLGGISAAVVLLVCVLALAFRGSDGEASAEPDTSSPAHAETAAEPITESIDDTTDPTPPLEEMTVDDETASLPPSEITSPEEVAPEPQKTETIPPFRLTVAEQNRILEPGQRILAGRLAPADQVIDAIKELDRHTNNALNLSQEEAEFQKRLRQQQADLVELVRELAVKKNEFARSLAQAKTQDDYAEQLELLESPEGRLFVQDPNRTADIRDIETNWVNSILADREQRFLRAVVSNQTAAAAQILAEPLPDRLSKQKATFEIRLRTVLISRAQKLPQLLAQNELMRRLYQGDLTGRYAPQGAGNPMPLRPSGPFSGDGADDMPANSGPSKPVADDGNRDYVQEKNTAMASVADRSNFSFWYNTLYRQHRHRNGVFVLKVQGQTYRADGLADAAKYMSRYYLRAKIEWSCDWEEGRP